MFMETNALSRSNYPIDYDPAHRILKTNKWLKTCILLSSFTFAREKLFIFSAMIAVLQEIFLGKQEVGRTLSLTSPKPGIVLYSSPPKPDIVLYSYLIKARYCPLFLPHPSQVLSFILTLPKQGIVLYSYSTQARYCPLFLPYQSQDVCSLVLPYPSYNKECLVLPHSVQVTAQNVFSLIRTRQSQATTRNICDVLFSYFIQARQHKFLWLIIIRLISRLYIDYWY